MSTSHWNYCQHRISDDLRTVASDEAVQKRWPRLARRLQQLLEMLPDIIADLDADLSGDSRIKNDLIFEAIALGRLDDAKVITPLRDALRVVLLFHGEDWTEEKRQEWQRITGSEYATSKVMCDHIRRLLGGHQS